MPSCMIAQYRLLVVLVACTMPASTSLIAGRLYAQIAVYLAALPNTAEEEGGDKSSEAQQAVAEAAAVTGSLTYVRYIPEGASL